MIATNTSAARNGRHNLHGTFCKPTRKRRRVIAFTISVPRALVVICAILLCRSAPVAAQLAGQTLILTAADPYIIFNDNNSTYGWLVEGNHGGFWLQDTTAGTMPFNVEPGSPNDSLAITPTGVGMGIFQPLKSLHVSTSGLFPTLRLDSTHITGAYTWDLEGSAGGFSLVDVSNTNSIPLSVYSGAPTNSFLIDTTGRVGLGTANPGAQLHGVTPAFSGSEAMARFQISDDAVGRLEINNATASNGLLIPRLQGRSNSANAALIMEGLITTDSGSNPCIVYNAARGAGGAVNRPLVVYRNNNVAKVTVAANGNITANSFITVSSRELKDKITDLASDKASDALRRLNPVEFIYKDDPSADPRVGFIAEDVPDLIAEPDRKSVPVMDVIALVTKVVKDQQRTIEELQRSNEDQKRSNDEQRKLIETLLNRLNQVESQIAER